METMPARLGTRDRRERANKKQPQEQRRAAKLSRLYKPEDMSLENWQIELRRQFGRDQRYKIVNVGDHPFFSEFEVTNTQNKNSYRVAVRGRLPGDNFCSCPDFATNALGTCKHIEFTLGYLEHKRGGKTALRGGFEAWFDAGYPVETMSDGLPPLEDA